MGGGAEGEGGEGEGAEGEVGGGGEGEGGDEGGGERRRNMFCMYTSMGMVLLYCMYISVYLYRIYVCTCLRLFSYGIACIFPYIMYVCMDVRIQGLP